MEFLGWLVRVALSDVAYAGARALHRVGDRIAGDDVKLSQDLEVYVPTDVEGLLTDEAKSLLAPKVPYIDYSEHQTMPSALAGSLEARGLKAVR